ncbi:ABC transporter ATP-binding protein [Rhabdochromatium marinum]|uniref:ABC transporter ATP-binding protein n=1 Tax=Rhabdochromatium marinum TaxID=48729 RepID=UPI001908569C|nr:ABC transporter ATP-binding protein [Rhabdochromatium marinum]MBK1649249.1 methionine ABC transporter ATP-binding protein [Rhabdochromatium marinum]
MVIEIRELTFRWQPHAPWGLTIKALTVAPGERLFIKGPSGSGKSTLLSLISGVTTATAGSVRVMGQPLEQLGRVERDHVRAHHIGYIFQMFNLIPYLSVLDNVTLPCRFSARRRAKARARSRSLEAEARRLLQQLDMNAPDLQRRAVTTLSVGQQQRVAAARALMGAPEVLIADEPTSALDADRRESFMRLLFDECRDSGAALVCVSHDAALESLFDRTLDLAAVNAAAKEKELD